MATSFFLATDQEIMVSGTMGERLGSNKNIYKVTKQYKNSDTHKMICLLEVNVTKTSAVYKNRLDFIEFNVSSARPVRDTERAPIARCSCVM